MSFVDGTMQPRPSSDDLRQDPFAMRPSAPASMPATAASVWDDPKASTWLGEGDDPGILRSVWGSSPLAAIIDLNAAPQFKADPTFDADALRKMIGGSKYENYLDAFLGARSPDEAKYVMSEIDRHEGMADSLARGGVAGVLGGFVSGMLSPTIFIPLGGLWRGAALGARSASAVAARAAEGATLTAGAAAIDQTILEAADPTHTDTDTLWGIGFATLIGGLLGGAVGLLSKGEAEGLTNGLKDYLSVGDEAPASGAPAAQGAGAQASGAGRGSGRLAGSLGTARAFKVTTPGYRTIGSEIDATRNAARDLFDTNVLQENVEGVPTSPGGSVEAQVKSAQGPLVDLFENYRSGYSRYFFGKQVPMAPAVAPAARLFGVGKGKLPWDGFVKAISDAALNGDAHVIPEVAEMARLRRKLVNDWRDEGINVIPGFRELVEAGSADTSYLTRIWNRVAVRARRGELRAILTQHFIDQQNELLARVDDLEARTGVQGLPSKVTELSRQEIESLSDEVIDNILGQSPGRTMMPGDFAAGPRGPLKERALASLPTSKVLDFVERDISKIDTHYVRTMATDIALTKKFGSVDMLDQIQKINDEANAKIAAAKSEREAKRLDKVRNSDIRDLTAMRDRIRGTYALPDNPDGILHRSIHTGKTLNYMASLGFMTVSAISDLAKPVMVHGLTRTMGTALTPFTRGLKAIKLAKKDVKLAGQGLDLITNDRVATFADVADQYGHGTVVERGVDRAGRLFSFAALMAPWNTVVKQFSGIITQTRALQAIEDWVGGKISAKDKTFLASNGIDANLAERISAEFRKHGGKDGAVWWANTADWTDKQAVQALRSAVNREVDNIIVTPGVADKPLWASTQTGQVIAQFQSFAMASVQRTMVAGLQQRDMAVLNGVMLAMGLGMLQYYLKSELNGQEPSDKPGVWIYEAFDNAGLGGWLMNANHSMEKITGDRIGLSALTGQPARRYINVNKLGAIFGPSVGKVSDMIDVFDAVSGGGMTQSDVKKIRRLVPLQNVFYLKWLFDQMEKGANDAFGLPTKKQN